MEIKSIKTSREPIEGKHSFMFAENVFFTQEDMITKKQSEEIVDFIEENVPQLHTETCYANTLAHAFQQDIGQTQKFMYTASLLRNADGGKVLELRDIGGQKALVKVGDFSEIGSGAELKKSEPTLSKKSGKKSEMVDDLSDEAIMKETGNTDEGNNEESGDAEKLSGGGDDEIIDDAPKIVNDVDAATLDVVDPLVVKANTEEKAESKDAKKPADKKPEAKKPGGGHKTDNKK